VGHLSVPAAGAPRRRARVWLLGLALIGWLGAAPASAEPQGWAYDLADELMSPYCPGRTLSECPSSQAQNLRMWLVVQEAAGRPEAEVKAELVERYGKMVLPAPEPAGFGLAAYVVPVAAFAAGGALLWAFLRRQTRERAEPAAAAPLDPELARLVDEELSR
jgi:cytochrome c-type biogenesis protein CcmH